MDIKQFEINLRKINTLKQNIELSGEEISKLEIELLKTYIKKLYESVALGEDLEIKEPVIIPAVPNKKKEEPAVETVKEVTRETVRLEEKKEPVEQMPEASPGKDGGPGRTYDEAILAIFETGKSSELSDKLGSMPITDIKKAIGINDRIFTINELFGGNNDIFNQTIDKLNSMSSFEEARDYLLEQVAEKFNWAQEDNAKKAKRFVKLVRRRYT
jgi:hypothetical protein